MDVSSRHIRPLPLKDRLDGLDLLSPSDSGLATRAAKADQAARECARRRLKRQFPATVIDALGFHFTKAGVHKPKAAGRRLPTVSGLLAAICSRTQEFRIGEKAIGMQIGVLGGSAPIALSSLGEAIEPDSGLCRADPAALAAVAAANASIEIRVFDRHLEEWSEIADDLAAVASADVFMKMFIAGGVDSVNDWHRDASDVIVTILDGAKGFAVATADSQDDAPVIDVDSVLQAGDVLLLPRSRLHKATPVGGLSALLSIGLMRMADWSYRGVSPMHLNIANPRSPRLYRLALRPHAPRTLGRLRVKDALRSRLPGGIGPVSERKGWSVILAAGRLWELSDEALDTLLLVHAAGRMPLPALLDQGGITKDARLEAAGELITAGLVRVDHKRARSAG